LINKILVANRGEIAVRIIRACKELNIETVAIYSEVDKNSLHTILADHAYCVGSKYSKDSYLHFSNILSIAIIQSVDAVHPGYGFLSENDEFAKMCEKNNIVFIGPKSNIIKKMGVKDEARKTMKENGIPVVPGSDSTVKSKEEAKKIAKKIGYPIVLKATAGGGGKGIRIVHKENDLYGSLDAVQSEAEQSFGNKEVYIEKYIENFRHIEIQVLADQYKNVIHLGERDCTLQRRMQKLVEESPSTNLSQEEKDQMANSAVKATKAIGYEGAGTIEYIYDLKDNKYYFMEMNTRIQVEHTVSEMVTGVDLVKEQIRIANNEKLTKNQEDIIVKGCAIECRINAENPNDNFSPSPGKVKQFIQPNGFGVRVETGIYSNYIIPPFYDSMIAKFIVHGDDREEAINKMKVALETTIIDGVKTTIPFLINLINNQEFKKNHFDNHFVSYNIDRLIGSDLGV